MKHQFTETTQVVLELAQDLPEVVPMELLSLVAGGLPFNVGASMTAGDAPETARLPFNVV